jgi:Acetyltransferase (GNAT) domain
MKIQIKELKTSDFPCVQKIYTDSNNKTFQHTPEFISYHGSRFENLSILITIEDEPIAYCLAAIDNSASFIVASHPGAAFGGLVTNDDVRGSDTVNLLECLLNHYSKLGFKEFTYKETPYIYAKNPSGDLAYATHRNGGVKKTSLLSYAVDLRNPETYSSQRTRGIKKGKTSVGIEYGWGNIEPFWELLNENLESRHSSAPVHSFAEIEFLKNSFKDEIDLAVARDKKSGKISAGVLLFKNSHVWKTQYIASNELGRKTGALDYLFNQLMFVARQGQIKYLDMGTSNEASGSIINEGLYRFKSGFGGGGLSYDQYKFQL